MQKQPELLHLPSSYQHRATVDVEDLASNKASVRGTQKQDRSRNLFRLSRAAQRNGGVNALADGCVMQRRCSHICLHPARRYAIYVDTVARQLRGKPFHHTDNCSLAGRVIAVERFSTLACGGTDQYDMPAGALLFHLCY